MQNAKTKRGVHIDERNKTFKHDELKLLKTQDQAYINHQRSINLSKIEKMKHRIHILDDAKVPVAVTEKQVSTGPSVVAEKLKTNKHIVFVENAKQAKSFDPAKHFNTLPEFVDRTFNRPKIDQIQNEEFPLVQEVVNKRSQKEKATIVNELQSRLDREKQLKRVRQELEIQRNLMVIFYLNINLLLIT